MLLFITGAGDATANLLFEKCSLPAFRLNIDLWQEYSLVLKPDRWEISNPAGLRITSESATHCFWWAALLMPLTVGSSSRTYMCSSFIIISTIAGWMLTMRNSMITTLSEDYVLMARAKGLSSRRVMFAYAARNAILPSVTGLAIALGAVVGGQFLVEVVFSYPGIGYALVQGIGNHDYSLTDGILLMVTLAIVAANFIVDLLYVLLDPRTRQGREA